MISKELDMKLARISNELADLMKCKSCCEFVCVFQDIRDEEGCPISEFMNRVEKVIEGE